MAKLAWSLLCRRVIVDETTKLASAIDVLEGFEFQTKPDVTKIEGLSLEFAAVCLWTRSDTSKPETVRQRLRLEGPDPKLNAPPPWEAVVDLVKTRNHRNVFLFQGFPYLGEGDYVFHVELQEGARWTEQSRMVLTVKRKAVAPES